VWTYKTELLLITPET